MTEPVKGWVAQIAPRATPCYGELPELPLATRNCCETEALFRSEIFLDFDIVVFLFLFDKHCPIIE